MSAAQKMSKRGSHRERHSCLPHFIEFFSSRDAHYIGFMAIESHLVVWNECVYGKHILWNSLIISALFEPEQRRWRCDSRGIAAVEQNKSWDKVEDRNICDIFWVACCFHLLSNHFNISSLLSNVASFASCGAGAWLRSLYVCFVQPSVAHNQTFIKRFERTKNC